MKINLLSSFLLLFLFSNFVFGNFCDSTIILKDTIIDCGHYGVQNCASNNSSNLNNIPSVFSDFDEVLKYKYLLKNRNKTPIADYFNRLMHLASCENYGKVKQKNVVFDSTIRIMRNNISGFYIVDTLSYYADSVDYNYKNGKIVEIDIIKNNKKETYALLLDTAIENINYKYYLKSIFYDDTLYYRKPISIINKKVYK